MSTLSLSMHGLQLAPLAEAERGAIYLVLHEGQLNLAVGISARNTPEDERPATGLLFLTGSQTLSVHFFVPAGHFGDIQRLPAYKTDQTWQTTRLVLEQNKTGVRVDFLRNYVKRYSDPAFPSLPGKNGASAKRGRVHL